MVHKNIKKIQASFNQALKSQARTQLKPVANVPRALYTTINGKSHFRMLRENGYYVDKNGIMRRPNNTQFNPRRPVKRFG